MRPCSPRTLVSLLFVATITSSGPIPADETLIVSRIRRAPVESKAEAAVGYRNPLRALEIEFVNRAIYRYFEVPRSSHDELIRGKYRTLQVPQRTK